jgi:hypothetical protein
MLVDGDPFFFNVSFYAEDGKYNLHPRDYSEKQDFFRNSKKVL